MLLKTDTANTSNVLGCPGTGRRRVLCKWRSRAKLTAPELIQYPQQQVPEAQQSKWELKCQRYRELCEWPAELRSQQTCGKSKSAAPSATQGNKLLVWICGNYCKTAICGPI